MVAVVLREERFLTIRRSQFVTAPGALCFPGGGIESPETEIEAIVRELHEELGIVRAHPERCLWRSITPRGVRLAWWHVSINEQVLRIDPQEVASFAWQTRAEILSSENLLVSNREFFTAVDRGEALALC